MVFYESEASGLTLALRKRLHHFDFLPSTWFIRYGTEYTGIRCVGSNQLRALEVIPNLSVAFVLSPVTNDMESTPLPPFRSCGFA